MALTIATWNINSVRLRADLVTRLLAERGPDVLCLQECKSPVEKLPDFAEAGYRWCVARGQKGYNGVAILSRLPIEDAGQVEVCSRGDARHVAARLENGVVVHNLYVPAGGDVPDPDLNPKFAHKLDFVARMQDWFRANTPRRSILVGDLNIAPREDDVWSHRQLLKVVSHTPVETEALLDAQGVGGWTDVTRTHHPEGPLFSWWSYRSPNWEKADRGRRLDHVWASSDIAAAAVESHVLKDARRWERPSDHVPVFATFDL
ncbi:exodeoxyribonuclease III [Roseitranquillus sediminis]|uniref:exodeoxyribonuclease III n=1 Tax=Roseitranquillus sediminis TaxID=2809051 RepID=UPI001D0CD64D|nr:exodeoxyribonuclease III [Roseitranquillus sediminis]MBM9596278.1 exodeoxyribonuclease III [Roseitranquillus sediminis]